MSSECIHAPLPSIDAYRDLIAICRSASADHICHMALVPVQLHGIHTSFNTVILYKFELPQASPPGHTTNANMLLPLSCK